MINAFYKKYQKHFDVSENNFAHFVMWSCGGICIGFVIGLVGIAFHLALEWATEFRTAHPMLLWLLPFGGLAIVLAYRLAGQEKDRGTNFILVAVRANEAVTLRTAPLIFFSTVVTHLLGGSAGREGAALQLGGSIASSFGRMFQLNEREGRIMTMCGMAAGFAALFGTPLTSVIFAMEVITVGVMHYSAIVPCIISALVAAGLSQAVGIAPTTFSIAHIPTAVGLENCFRAAVLGVLCAKERLTLTNAGQRMLFGHTTTNPPSRFLREIPEENRVWTKSAAPQEFRPGFDFRQLTAGIGGRSASSAGRSSQSDVQNKPVERGATILSAVSSAAAELRQGDMVRHRAFGRGMVMSVQPMGGDALLEIAFDEVGTKRLMRNSAMAYLEKEGG